jgi:hypothetical protein
MCGQNTNFISVTKDGIRSHHSTLSSLIPLQSPQKYWRYIKQSKKEVKFTPKEVETSTVPSSVLLRDSSANRTSGFGGPGTSPGSNGRWRCCGGCCGGGGLLPKWSGGGPPTRAAMAGPGGGRPWGGNPGGGPCTAADIERSRPGGDNVVMRGFKPGVLKNTTFTSLAGWRHRRNMSLSFIPSCTRTWCLLSMTHTPVYSYVYTVRSRKTAVYEWSQNAFVCYILHLRCIEVSVTFKWHFTRLKTS